MRNDIKEIICFKCSVHISSSEVELIIPLERGGINASINWADVCKRCSSFRRNLMSRKELTHIKYFHPKLLNKRNTWINVDEQKTRKILRHIESLTPHVISKTGIIIKSLCPCKYRYANIPDSLLEKKEVLLKKWSKQV